MFGCWPFIINPPPTHTYPSDISMVSSSLFSYFLLQHSFIYLFILHIFSFGLSFSWHTVLSIPLRILHKSSERQDDFEGGGALKNYYTNVMMLTKAFDCTRSWLWLSKKPSGSFHECKSRLTYRQMRQSSISMQTDVVDVLLHFQFHLPCAQGSRCNAYI